MTQRTIVVLGGALSGPTAAARAREIDERARILLIERGRHVSYAACGLAYHLSGEVADPAALDAETAELLKSVYRIEVWTGAEATALDAGKRMLRISRGGGDSTLQAVQYDALVFALGAASKTPEVPGLTGPCVTGLRTPDDLQGVRAALAAGRKRVAVLGGGPLGVEAADGLARGGAEVVLIEKEAAILPRFGRQASRLAELALARSVQVCAGTAVTAAEPGKGPALRLRLSNGRSVEADLVVCAIGLAPRTELLAKAGARLAPDGTAIVDDRARTSLPDLFACGVCVSVPQAMTGAPAWWAQGSIADKTAQVAGTNAAGGNARLAPALGTMIVRALDAAVGRTGLSHAEAAAQVGAEHVRATTVHALSHDAFFPAASPLLIQLIWDARTGRLLGAEAAGKAGVDKRLDAAAAALAGGLTVEQLAGTDFAYAPPFASQRDALNVAATVAAAERAGLARPIDPAALRARLGAIQLVDVRSAAEGRAVALPGATAIPLEELAARTAELDRAKPTVTFCSTGRRGYLAARLLLQNGFADVAHLAGGTASWALVHPA